MDITHAHYLWLTEESLSATPRWLTLPKGSTVYLLSHSWLSAFRDAVTVAIAAKSTLNPDQCVIDNTEASHSLSADGGEWSESEFPPNYVVVPESIYTRLFQPFCTIDSDEIKGWVMWKQGFHLSLLAKKITIMVYLRLGKGLEVLPITFEDNVTVSKMLQAIYQMYPKAANSRSKAWAVKWNWACDNVVQYLSANKKSKSIANLLDESVANARMLEVLESLHIIIRVKTGFSASLLPHAIVERFSHSKTDKSVGLQNLGNTCFLNCILQSLVHVPQIAIYYHKFEPPHSTPLNRRFAALVKDLYGSEAGSVISPTQLKAIIDGRLNAFANSSQHDAEELLSGMLQELISENSRKSQTLQYPGTEELDALTWQMQASSASYVSSLFTGLYQEVLCCLSCGHRSAKFTEFRSLSLNLTPSRLYRIRLIDFYPSTLQKSFMIEVAGSMEQEVTFQSLWVTITDRTGDKNLLFGYRKNRLFYGPLETSVAPKESDIVALRLPFDLRPQFTAVLFDVYESDGAGWQELGTRVAVINNGIQLIELPTEFAKHLLVAGNALHENWSMIQRTLNARMPEGYLSTLANSLEVRIEVRVEGTNQHRSLSELQSLLGVSTFAELLPALDRRDYPRFQCYFVSLNQLITSALSYFKEDEKITVESYSESQLTVTISQLIDYNRRLIVLDESRWCEHCSNESQFTLQQRVEKFPPVLVLPIQRGVVRDGTIKKCNMKVCFPSKGLDLSDYEDALLPSPPVYNLVAVVRHKGKSMTHGHYIAYVRSPVTTQWSHCSDSKCKRVSEDDVLRTEEAYMLLYVRN